MSVPVRVTPPLLPAMDDALPAGADAGALGRRLERAWDDPANEIALRRLARAQTTVALRVTDAPEHGVTLLLDRRPPELVLGVESAEVSFTFTREQAERFAHGRLILALELMSREVKCTGPVRRYLALDAILRRLLSRT